MLNSLNICHAMLNKNYNVKRLILKYISIWYFGSFYIVIFKIYHRNLIQSYKSWNISLNDQSCSFVFNRYFHVLPFIWANCTIISHICCILTMQNPKCCVRVLLVLSGFKLSLSIFFLFIIKSNSSILYWLGAWS